MIENSDVVKSLIRFYDSKTQSKRLMLVADKTDNNELLCFNVTSAKVDEEKNQEYIFIPKSAENKLKYDSYIKCNTEYILATDSVYTELDKTPLKLNDSDFNRVAARYELLKAQNKVTRIYNSVEPKQAEFDKLKAQVIQTAENYKRDPKLMAELVDFRAKFYDYSLNNAMLIMAQNKNATFVASFNEWKSLGYGVNKGEKGLKILVPYEVTYYEKDGVLKNVRNASREDLSKIYNKNENETVKKTYFTIGHVFDISQTNCPASDYPKVFDMGYESAGHAALYESIKGFAEKIGFKVVEDTLDSIALKGFFRPADDSITINNKLGDSEKLATITHEFAHALMHKTSTQPLEVMEFEAECLSHMIQRRFGMPISDMNKDYISTYYSKIKNVGMELDKSFIRISKAFKHVTTGFDKELTVKGFDISPERGKYQSKDRFQQVSAEKVTQNFLQEIE